MAAAARGAEATVGPPVASWVTRTTPRRPAAWAWARSSPRVGVEKRPISKLRPLACDRKDVPSKVKWVRVDDQSVSRNPNKASNHMSLPPRLAVINFCMLRSYSQAHNSTRRFSTIRCWGYNQNG